jgi:N-methylhydantoinase A
LPPYRIGIDVGGTFTDLVLLDETTGAVRHTKVLTTAPNPADGVLHALGRAAAEFGFAPGQVTAILHGTTIATNSLIERKGPRTALLTTRGFRDVLEIGRQIRPSLFDWEAEKPEPVVPRRWRFEVTERVTAQGEVKAAPSGAEVDGITAQLRAAGIEAVAVSFLFSFLRPEHEEAVGLWLAEALPGVDLSLSCQVLPEYREYERTATTAANAFLMPIMRRYADGLDTLKARTGVATPLHLLQSNGGLTRVDSMRRLPVTIALSGPAGGAMGACHLAGELGEGDIISMDMGGTSCDVCLVMDGRATWTIEGNVGGLPIRTPMINVHSIGAGGGSIVWVDSGGALRVGPHSAGSHPGPACYDRGGREATLTDAHVLLGTVLPEYFKGKGIEIRPERAEEALKTVAARTGLGVRAVAEGAIRIINHHIAQAVRAVSLAKGYDPRDFALVPFGGAGPLHACLVAEELGITSVILPVAPGVFSAFGAALADFRRDAARSLPGRLQEVTDVAILDAFRALEAAVRPEVQTPSVRSVRVERAMDLRYVGQSFEITVPVAGGEGLDRPAILSDFHRLHEEAYGFSDPEEPVELVNVRVRALGLTPKPRLAGNGKPPSPSLPPPRGSSARIPDVATGQVVDCQVLDRGALQAGHRVAGPLLIMDPSSSILVPPGWSGVVDGGGNILLSREAR